MSRNTHFQDYLLTDLSSKLWLRKSDDKTAFLFFLPKEN